MKIEIVNVVLTGDLKQRVHLKKAGKLEGALYDFDIYHCAYFKLPEMHGKVSVFETGKMISQGTKKPEQADHDLRYVPQRLIKTGQIKPVEIGDQSAKHCGDNGPSHTIQTGRNSPNNRISHL